MITSFIPKLLLGIAAVVMTASVAFAAMTLESAKTQGLVGERADGMLGIVAPAPSPDVTALVNTINAERLEKYQGVAAKNGTDLEKVKALAGQKLVGNAKPGEYVMSASGTWMQK